MDDDFNSQAEIYPLEIVIKVHAINSDDKT